MRAPRFNPLFLAGWLFADMLLVLALVAMGDQGDPQAVAKARPSASAAKDRPEPSPKPSPSGARAVSRTPVKVAVDAPAGDVRSIKEQVRSATEKYAGRQAAIVLTFGRHPDPAGGGKYATEVNSALRTARPEMFGKATTRDFWKGGSAGGHADIEIYFYTYEN